MSFKIICEHKDVPYVFWSGCAWTENAKKAQLYPSRKEAEKEMKSLSYPRGGLAGVKVEPST